MLITKTVLRCSNCFEFKLKTEFYPRYKDGERRQSRCKKCNAEVVFGYNQRKKEKRREQYENYKNV